MAVTRKFVPSVVLEMFELWEADAGSEEGPGLPRRPPFPLYVPGIDDHNLSEYYCLVRQQIEFFEATDQDVVKIGGRHKPIVLGQVGIRCRHCSSVHPGERKSAQIYYPSDLEESLPDLCRKMVNNHLLGN